MNRRADWRRVRTHLSYTYEEVAQVLSVHRMTVRHWTKNCGLQVLKERRPHLILGADLIVFLKARRSAKRKKCSPGEMYCLKCRVPRKPVPGLLEHRCYSASRGAIVGICEVCQSLMHRLVSARRLTPVATEFKVQIERHHNSLIGTSPPSLNCYSDGTS